jgi:hypothetical protein
MFQNNLAVVVPIGIIVLTLSYAWYGFLSPRARKFARLPPGPRPKPIIGNTLDFPSDEDDASAFWGSHLIKYGPISSLRVPGQIMIILNDRQLCFELLDKRANNYSGRPRMIMSGEIMGNDQGMLLIQPNERWRSYRRLSHAQLGSFTTTNRWRSQFELEARRYLLDLLEAPEDFVTHIRRSTGALILRILYGYTVDRRNDRLVKMIVSTG